MKATLVIVFFLLVSRISQASTTDELDSLRKVILQPKLQEFNTLINNYTASIKNTKDKKSIKLLAIQIIDASDDLMSDIRGLYGFKHVSVVTPVYVGANVQIAMYPNVGGFIFPTSYSTVGSLPDLYEELAYIKDYAWRIRLKTTNT
jgi:hypothetical protein